MKISFFFDGTKCSLKSPNKTIVSYLYEQCTYKEVHISKSFKEFYNLNQSLSYKFYFPGPASINDDDHIIHTPGRDYNPEQISALLLSTYSVRNRIGISGSGWQHNLQMALIISINIISEYINKNETNKVTISIPCSYSRGAITAIAFSSTLSEILSSIGYTQKQVEFDEINLIDPVSGLDYGKLSNSINRAYVKNNLHEVSPIKIGSYTKVIKLYLAKDEQRTSYKPQMPCGIDGGSNNRPLFIPDSTKAIVYLMGGSHRSVVSMDSHNNCYTLNLIRMSSNTTHQGYEKAAASSSSSSQIFKTRIFYPTQPRDFIQKNMFHMEYHNSVLNDVFNEFIKNNNNSDTFISIFRDKNHRYNSLFIWAYMNSNFYRTTEVKPDHISDYIVALAVMAQTRTASATLGINYKNFSINTPLITRHLSFNELETFIFETDQMASINNEYNINKRCGYIDELRQVLINSIYYAIIHLRTSSMSKKLYKLKKIESLIKTCICKKKMCYLLYLAIRIVQHRTGKMSFRFQSNYSKDYKPETFISAMNWLGVKNFKQYESIENTDITYANFKVIIKKLELIEKVVV